MSERASTGVPITSERAERLATRLEAVEREERTHALRLLLRHPLLTPQAPDPQGFALVRKHADFLKRWFGDWLGYRALVEPECARLLKVPPARLAPRHLRTRQGRAFTPRLYALFCLVLAALEHFDTQATLSQLAEDIALRTRSDPRLTPLDLDSAPERRAFVHAIQVVSDLGCIELRDGDEEGFVRGGQDALYDIDARALARLMSARVPPSSARSAEELRTDVYPHTEEGRRRRARHSLMRRLVEDPVVYADDLDSDESSYLRSQKHRLLRELHDTCGFAVEQRAEGWACIDEDEQTTDVRMPTEGTVGHAALLIAETLVARRGEAIAPAELERSTQELIDRFGKLWRADARSEGGAARLLGDVVALLEAFDLVDADHEGVRARPALARFATQDVQEA